MAGGPVHVQVVARRHARLRKIDFETPGVALTTKRFSVPPNEALWTLGKSVEPAGASRRVRASWRSHPVLQFRTTAAGVEASPTQSEGLAAESPRLLISKLPLGRHALREGDLLQLQAATVEVCEIVKSPPSDSRPRVLGTSSCACVTPGDARPLLCRICLGEGPSTAEDPLLRPCACSGSVEHVHLACLRRWIHTFLKLDASSPERFDFKIPACEMCKVDLPALVRRGDAVEHLVDALPLVKAPYLVLRSTPRSSRSRSHASSSPQYHVVSFADAASIGVGHSREAGVFLDSSQSGMDARIFHEEECFFVEDGDTRHGTFLTMKGAWPLSTKRSLTVLVEATVLHLQLVEVADAWLGAEDARVESQPFSDVPSVHLRRAVEASLLAKLSL